ncbi:MAG: ExbD/TolR family protein [Vulcanimicrobiaceae bacterium]
MIHLVALLVITVIPSPTPHACYADSLCKDAPVACFAATAKKSLRDPCSQIPKAEMIETLIDAQGSIRVDGHSVRLTDVRAYFERLAAAHPNAVVQVIPDVQARYGTVLQVVDAAKQTRLQVRLGPVPPALSR